MEKQSNTIDRMRKLFSNVPNNSTPNVLSQPPPTTKAKNQVKNRIRKHKHTKKKRKQKKRLKIT